MQQQFPQQLPQPQYQQEPGREGMLGPEQSVLQQLLGADQNLRDPGQSDAGLIQAMNQARGQGQSEDMRAIRRIIEGRHSDDIARGPKPAAVPVTSADPNEKSWFQRLNPFNKVGESLQDANQRSYEANQNRRLGR